MNLIELASSAGVTMDQLHADPQLKRGLQQRLSALGCLDPPPDGNFGPVSQLALDRVADLVGVRFDGDGVEPALAQALLDHTADTLLPLRLDDGLASRIVRFLLAAGNDWWFARLPGFLNIIYVEGVDADGSVNADTPNVFNDRRLVVDVRDGVPTVVHNTLATTEPGRFYTVVEPHPQGAARIAFGFHKAWHVGIHKAGKPTAHEALTQASDLPVWRDADMNFIRPGDELFVGSFGINQHSGHNASPDNIHKASAGCLVARSTSDHRDFMALVKTDARYQVNRGYRFCTTVIDGTLLPA